MTSIRPDMPPTLKRKFALIEQQFGKPVWQVVREMAAEDRTRVEVAEALRYHPSNFYKLLASRWAPKDLPWRYRRHGDGHHASVLEPADVVLIRRLRPRPGRPRPGELTLAEIAEKFGVSYRTVQAVVTYETWRHVA